MNQRFQVTRDRGRPKEPPNGSGRTCIVDRTLLNLIPNCLKRLKHFALVLNLLCKTITSGDVRILVKVT